MSVIVYTWTNENQKVYGRLPNVTVEELRLKEQDLNTKRMLDLMAVGAGTVPLYIHVIQRVLRDMRIEQQATGGAFNYKKFKKIIDNEDLTAQQRVPLDQRLETLESFMVKKPTKYFLDGSRGTDWTPKVRAHISKVFWIACADKQIEGTTDGRRSILSMCHR